MAWADGMGGMGGGMGGMGGMGGEGGMGGGMMGGHERGRDHAAHDGHDDARSHDHVFLR